MKLIQNVIHRIVVHWQSTLFGIAYLALTYLMFKKEISVMEWGAGMGTLLSVKAMFLNKDPDKVQTKDQFKNPHNDENN